MTAFWIIVREPRCVPDLKRPPVNTFDGALDMLRELAGCRPEGTDLTLVETRESGNLYVQCGREALVIDATFNQFENRRRKQKVTPDGK